MISVIVLSSSHRESQLKQLASCLSQEKGFEHYQKIVVFDGDPKSLEDVFGDFKSQWEVIRVNRVDGMFCWADAINAGIDSSNFDKLLYLDGDRIVNSKFLLETECVKDDEFLFPGRLFTFNDHMALDDVVYYKQHQLFSEDLMWEDFREFRDPSRSFRKKNPMSGCVAFTKKTYMRTGGFDKMYVGYGYPDIDYFRKTYNLGCVFRPIDCIEYHLYHDYFPLTKEMVLIHGFWNAVQYCKKWNLDVPEDVCNSGKSLGLTIENVKKFSCLKDFERMFTRSRKII